MTIQRSHQTPWMVVNIKLLNASPLMNLSKLSLQFIYNKFCSLVDKKNESQTKKDHKNSAATFV
jgi:hypothetical protein